MNDFVYDATTKVIFGRNAEAKVGKLISEFKPNKVLIHFGMNSVIKSGLLDRVKSYLNEEKIHYVLLGGVVPNPTLEMVRKGIKLCNDENIDFILAVGGGSVIDSAKAIAAGVANPNDDVWDYNLGKRIPLKSLHKGAILTISAAGSECSNSCVITNTKTEEKRGFCAYANRLDFAIENPELTFTVSQYQTACGAVDIAMHTIERFFCPGGDTYLTDEIAIAIIKSAMKAGKDSFDQPNNYAARSNMMWASSLAHNGLTNCGREFFLTVHQLEHELSGMYPSIAHGAGLAALWCSWARYVYKSNIDRFSKFFKNIWDLHNFSNKNDVIIEGIRLQEEYYKSINMPTSLRELGVEKDKLETLALRCSRNKTRIIKGYKELGYQEILDIYNLAY